MMVGREHHLTVRRMGKWEVITEKSDGAGAQAIGQGINASVPTCKLGTIVDHYYKTSAGEKKPEEWDLKTC